jgi:mRNA interferase MazF
VMSGRNRRGMADAAAPQRGEVWLVSFDPAIGGEIQKTRPALVISNDTANTLLNRVQVVPISSQVSRLYPAEAFISLNGERRKAMADQITTASKQRLVRRLGALAPEDLTAVIRAVCVQLGI